MYLHCPVLVSDCRPCSVDEILTAYCSSDFGTCTLLEASYIVRNDAVVILINANTTSLYIWCNMLSYYKYMHAVLFRCIAIILQPLNDFKKYKCNNN